ncbi:uncharacterized protein LOC134181591 [Corticium candelabrum]|uniref:uncharacterized protein LOC134181591 n=1 Tax=Corticium candelabrum TaxID=121492 RepID=UPI002E276856|nr:uncharacterized protein LOC134181591 [Corticium candelabrum]
MSLLRVLICVSALMCLCESQVEVSHTLATCKDYYDKLGNKTDKTYLLEVSPFVMVEIFCSGMSSGKPTEYLTLGKGAANNFARYFRQLGKDKGSSCGAAIPTKDATGWGLTRFNRIRLNVMTNLVDTDDFKFSTSTTGGSKINYGEAGDKYFSGHDPNCWKGNFKIDLTDTPYEVSPDIDWTWQGTTIDNAPNGVDITESAPRQTIVGKCGGYPGNCFPALVRSPTNSKLILRIVPTNPCVRVNNTNPCQNGATCIPNGATSYACRCVPGWLGPNCDDPEPDKVIYGTRSAKRDDAQSKATCPAGYTLTHCQCEIGACDGAVIANNAESCTAYNNNNKNQVRVQINCTRFNRNIVSTSVIRDPSSGFANQHHTITCPTGWKILACTYHSYWFRGDRPDSGLATIEGDNVCKIDCKVGGGKACAIYAKCYTDYCLCLNGGTCSGITHHCICPTGYVGSRCETFDYCAWQLAQQGSPPCQNGGTCKSVPATAIGTYDGDGIGGDCKLPFRYKQMDFSGCVDSNVVGPPFACGVATNGGRDYVDLGSWSPGTVFTLEGWVKPTLHINGRKTIFGTMDACRDWGVVMNNDKFGFAYQPKSGCSVTKVTTTKGWTDQWHHVALTQDETTMTLYVNGTSRGSAATKPKFLGSAASFRVGGEICCGNNYWPGVVKNLNVWKKSLGATEIMKLYKNPPPKPFDVADNVIRNHLIASYEFGEKTTPTCTGGKDHKNADWIPKNGDIISGIHCNIKTFYIPAGVTVQVDGWVRTKNSNTGVKGTVTIHAQDILIKGTLHANGKGYVGGARPTSGKGSGKQGESFTSAGSTSTGQLQGGGGGGLGDTNSRAYGKPGGGGGHGTAGKNGYDKRGNQGGVGKGGIANSHGDLRVLELGAGGGSGGNDNAISDNPLGGMGGNGGGGIYLDATNTLTVSTTGRVRANGQAGQGDSASSCGNARCYGRSKTNCWDWSGPGGGGAGGSIYLRSLVVDIGTNRVTAAGGRGGYGTSGCGGNGGTGRIRIDSHILNGNTNPAPYKVVINDTFIDLATLARDTLPPSALANTPEPSVYLGCFEDSADRHFKYQAPSSNTMTPDMCKDLCYQKGYSYYALQYYRECFCDNNFKGYARKSEGDCNTPCDGDKNTVCGGGWRMNVYGPVPRAPAVAKINAVRKCEPYCKTGWRSNRMMYGLCIGQGKVNSWNIECTCPVGFTGSRCQDPCPAGKYGQGCTKTCGCKNGGVCDPVDGSCSCPAGWTGGLCGAACPATKFGPGCTAVCKCNRYCSPSESLTCGYSTTSHKVAFVMEAESGTLGKFGAGVKKTSPATSGGAFIDVIGADEYTAWKSKLIASYTIDVTIAGDYYPWLEVITPNGKADSVFISFDNSGKRTWHIGQTKTYQWRAFGGFQALTVGIHQMKIWKRESGLSIDRVFLGPAQAASTCNRFNGSCTCQPGFVGQFCESPCNIGNYGVGCKETCNCGAHGTCDPRDGTCHCVAGYQGATCSLKCTGNTYGTGCQSQCKCSIYGTCDHVTGVCKCNPGYTGPTCNQACQANHYGQDCAKVCQCRNGGNCDGITGTCQCTPGYTGSDCGKACPVGKYGQDCKQTCKCDLLRSTCNHITGHCDCKQGFKGTNCNQNCGNGQCGLGCKFSCQCNNHGRCSKTDCSCSCYPGWSGVGCATACGQGRFGVDCSQACDCKHGSCNRFNGKCTCQNGWKGSDCGTQCTQGTFGKDCASTCKCVSANTQTCDPMNGKCTCNKGWAGLFCETQCPAGTFGQDCLGNCSCLNGGACHNAHGTCDCPPGYYGPTCASTCSVNKFGYDCKLTCVCANGASCDPVDGSCTCADGWFGPTCNVTCPTGSWGPGCNNLCMNCSQGSCDSVTGQCTCFPGFTGPGCTQPCPAGMWGPGCHQTCNCVNGRCDVTDGTCICNGGYKGSDCSVSCKTGTYGVGCLSACPRKCQNSLSGCDPVDGHCICTAGWSGPWCNASCPDGTYGPGCSQKCSSCLHPSKSLKCHPVTGACVCSHGYQGDLCDAPCDDGWWGLNCTEQCACPALRSSCDIVDGTCSCLPGYLGDSCDQTCPNGFWGDGCTKRCVGCDASNPHGFCNPENGVCHCLAGWSGTDCTTPCLTGKWGIDCQEDCLCEFGTCNKVDGSCLCSIGFTGDYCDATCVNNTYGAYCSLPCSCQNGATCNRYTGRCDCQPGYTGYDCDKECEDSTFGHLCARKCDCDNQAPCNKTTGECICPSGLVGARCEEPCPSTNWGPDCKFACGICVNGKCNSGNGACDCDPGWQGANCSVACVNSFGVGCSTPCPTCPNNYPCDGESGTCLCGGVRDYCVKGTCSSEGECGCDPGYRGDNCSIPCPTGRWGDNCDGICNCGSETCNIATGQCGCDKGQCGSRCEQTCDCPLGCHQDTCVCLTPQEQEDSSSSDSSIGVPAIAGIAVSCVLLGILVTIIVFIYLRHKAKTLGEMQGPMDMTGQVKFDNNADNVGFSNPIYSTSDEPIKANPIYSSKDDRLDDVDDNPDYTAPY